MNNPPPCFLIVLSKSVLSVLFLIFAASAASIMAQTTTLQFSAAEYTVDESSIFTATVTRTGDNSNPVSVQYATANITATGGAPSCVQGLDYISTTGTLNWAVGDGAPKTLTVTICNDTAFEPHEKFSITLSNATGGASIETPSTAVVTIEDNDFIPGIPVFSPKLYYQPEGTAAVISLTRPPNNSSGTISVNYSTTNLTATGGEACGLPGVDYVRATGRLTFNPGEITKTFTIQICSDSLFEGNETIWLVGSYDFTTVAPELATLVISGIIPAGNDFDGDRRTDVSVFRPSNGNWHILPSQSGAQRIVQFGLATDRLVSADYDGDGRSDIAVFRDGFWFWLSSSNNSFNAFQFGIAGDVPLPADYTGDGRVDLAVYRAGWWYWLNLNFNQILSRQFGLSSDKPVPADFDGDGTSDIAVYRDGYWFWISSTDLRFNYVPFGLASDKPVAGDYDGDGKADQAVYRNGVWHIRGSASSFSTQFGLASDIPVPGDYDGDGKTDIAVFRDGVWYQLRSQQGFTAIQYGNAGDKPVPAALIP